MAEMSPNATLDDIVFANRNKAYGAYPLRQEYRGVINRATLMGAAIFILAMLAPMLADKFLKTDEKQEVMVDVNLMNLPPPPIDLSLIHI